MCRYRSDAGTKQKVRRQGSPLRQFTSDLVGPGVSGACIPINAGIDRHDDYVLR